MIWVLVRREELPCHWQLALQTVLWDRWEDLCMLFAVCLGFKEGLCRALFKHRAPMQLLPEAALGEQGLAFQARGASAAGRLGMLAVQHEAGC